MLKRVILFAAVVLEVADVKGRDIQRVTYTRHDQKAVTEHSTSIESLE